MTTPKSGLPPDLWIEISASECTVHTNIPQDPVSYHLHSMERVVLSGPRFGSALWAPNTKYGGPIVQSPLGRVGGELSLVLRTLLGVSSPCWNFQMVIQH